MHVGSSVIVPSTKKYSKTKALKILYTLLVKVLRLLNVMGF